MPCSKVRSVANAAHVSVMLEKYDGRRQRRRMKEARTFGIAYTKEPRELNEAGFNESVVVRNASIELPLWVIWI